MADKKSGISVVISAVDKLTPSLKTISKSVKALGKVAKDVGEGFGKLAESLEIPLALLGAGSVAGLAEAVKSFAEYGSIINDTSTKTGVATQQLQAYSYAAKLNGIEQETLFGSLTKLNKGLANAATGKNKDVAGLFKKLGVSMRDANGHLRKAGDLMPEIADAFTKIPNPAMRTKAAMALFGKTGADLIPTLMEGGKSLREAAIEAAKLGLVLSSEDIKQADELGDNFDKIHFAAQGLANTIGAKLAPLLNPLINQLIGWYESQREIIASSVAGVVKEVAHWLGSVNWKEIGQGIKDIAHGIGQFVQAVGGWKNVLLGFVALANLGVVAAVLQIAVAVGQLGLVLKAVGLIAGGWISLILLVGYTAYSVWANWSTVVANLKQLWKGFTEWFAGLFASWHPIDTVTNAFSAVGDYFHGLVQGIKDTFTSLIDFIPNTFHRIADAIPNAMDGIRNMMPDSFGLHNDTSVTANAGAGNMLQAVGAQRVNGEMTVKFEGAPPGMQVEPGKTNNSGWNLNADVGYNSRAFGMAGG